MSTRQQGWELQREAIRRAAAARGEEIAEFYEEKRSGSSRERPELDRLRQAVRAGHVSRLYVFRLDRLTRRGIRDTLELLEEFRGGGAVVVSVADAFDPAQLVGPLGELAAALVAWAAEMELLAKKERISAARERVAAKGGRWGRPRKIDPTTLDAAKKLVFKDNVSVRVAAQRLKVKKTTLLRALHEKGHYARKKEDGQKDESGVRRVPAADRKVGGRRAARGNPDGAV